ncbi:MAG: hypothetical protein M1833_006945 [Piccolia ochrophora]|nr:MAG: hypothetical protein M1833_006945 [Piccolia ochrophora]
MFVPPTLGVFAIIFSAADASQPLAPAPVPAPLRELPWGQLNFLHTTDTHGWHAGHLQEPSYAADWGDYASFAHHMKNKAAENNDDLLLIDTGDRVEGNGLYDASHPPGNYTTEVLKQLDIDIICSGNHELYKANTSDREYHTIAPSFKGNYLASNVDIFDPKSGDLVPLAPRFRKFTTKNQQIRILAFGFLFDFTGNANNTVVQPVEKTIEEEWFHDAIRDEEIDLVVIIGHVAVRSKEYEAVFKAIREVKWDTPIQFFGGHTHIRDYAKYDASSYALESGRYLETVGFMSISGLSHAENGAVRTTAGPEFQRRYIDNNLYSFYHHTGLNDSTFPTPKGDNISRFISEARDNLELDTLHGCAPQNYWLNRAPYPSNDSILTLTGQQILPTMVVDESRKDSPRMILLNSGAIRFDVFKGPFTRDTAYIVSPFTNGFRYIESVPYGVAKQLLSILNSQGPILEEMAPKLQASALAPPQQNSVRSSPEEFVRHQRDQEPLHVKTYDKPDLIPGYTTKDDAGEDGDDTLHSPISFYRVPNCIQSEVAFPDDDKEPERVDLVFIAFIQPWIIIALRFLGEEYDVQDVQEYAAAKGFTQMLTAWVDDNWGKDCKV